MTDKELLRSIIFCVFFVSLGMLQVAAQPVATVAVERGFEKLRKSLAVEKFEDVREIVPGEGSKFEYLYYHDSAGNLVKIRLIEREDKPDASIKVDDYFFINGDLRLVRLYFFINSSRLKALRNGAIVPLLTGEHIEMKDRKLVRWNTLGKEIPTTDKRWEDKQRSVLGSLEVELMYYSEFKKPKESGKPQ